METMLVSSPHPGVLARYGEFLPVTDDTPMLTLGEGDTPLVRLSRIGRGLIPTIVVLFT